MDHLSTTGFGGLVREGDPREPWRISVWSLTSQLWIVSAYGGPRIDVKIKTK